MSNENSQSFELNSATTANDAIQSSGFEIRQAVKKGGAMAIEEALERLITKRKNWELNEFARSNQCLYSILQHCYAIYQQMNGTDATAISCKVHLNEYCLTAGIKFKASTGLMHKIVRCVFGDCNGDRQRVSAYAKALQIAAEAKIKAEDIPNYFIQEGGVEQIRRKKVAQTDTKPSRVEVGKTTLDNDVIASVKSVELDKVFDAAEYLDSVLLLATREADGSFAVRKLIQNSSVIDKAFASLATDINKAVKAKAPEKQAAHDQQQRDAAVIDAIAA